MSYAKFYPAKRFKWHITPLEDFREMLTKRRDNQLDNMVLITGARGVGKSTFVGKILFGFEDFQPFEQIVYSKEAMFKQIKKKRSFVWADEAVVNSAKGNVMTRANKLLFEATTINRDNFNICFLCIPFVEDFDSKILQYISAWIHIESRGLGVLMLPSNKGIFGKRNWDLTHMKKIFDEFVKETKGERHVPFWIYDNFRGYIKFGKLTQHQQEIVDEIKRVKKNENLDKTTEQEVALEVKEVNNYARDCSMKLAKLIMEGKIRSMEQFELNCKEYKLIPEEMMAKCDSILKRNNIGKSTKGLIKDYLKQDTKLF